MLRSSDLRTVAGRLVVCSLVCLPFGWTVGSAQAPGEDEPLPGNPPAALPDEPAGEYSSPYEAFDAGAWDQALERFVDQQTLHPDDPELTLNVGAAHYKLNDFESADTQFYRAAALGDGELRAQALYNLGNSAYRQGKLGDAVDFYVASLEANPDDLDAKFNLEFVREEMKRQQQNQGGENQDGDGENQEQQEQQQEDGQAGSEPQEPEQGEGDQPEDEQDPGAAGQDQPQGGEQQQDTDGDGLGDDVERGGENPTDPENPDSDADGLPDGQEDRNRNGRVDPGETDPNRQDSDGDGVPDADDSEPAGDSSDAGGRGGPQELPPGMTPEEAERYLQALEEGRPDAARRAQRGRQRRQAKDW